MEKIQFKHFAILAILFSLIGYFAYLLFNLIIGLFI